MQNNDFKELNKTQSVLFAVGGVLMVLGIGCFVFMFQQQVAGCVFLVGAILFALMQCMQIYTGSDRTLRRLKSIMNLADLLFVLTGVLMIDTAITNAGQTDPIHAHRFLSQMFTNWSTYIECVYNKWIVLLFIAVTLEVYTTHRISHELGKNAPDSRSEN